MENGKILAIVIAAVVVLGVGVAGFFLLGEPTAEEIGQQMEQRFAEIDDYQGTMTANSVRVADRPEPMTQDEMERQARIAAEEGPMTFEQALENIQQNQPEGGTVVVYDRTNTAEVQYLSPDRHRYDYDEDPNGIVSNTGAVTLDGDKAYFHRPDRPPTEQDRSLVSVTTVGIPFDEYVPTITEDYEIEINETLTDEETYVLNLTAKEDTNVDLELDRLRVDRDDMLPVSAYRRAEQTDEFGSPTGDYTEQRIEYDYEYNVGVDEEAFNVDVVEVDRPEPAETNESDYPEYEPVVEDNDTAFEQRAFEERTVERYDSIEEAEEEAGFEVSEPSNMPEGQFEIARITVRTHDNISAIDTTYQGNESAFMVRYGEEGFPTFASDVPESAPATVEEVEIGERTGELLTIDAMSIVTVGCADLTLEASSPVVSEDELLRVVESVGC